MPKLPDLDGAPASEVLEWAVSEFSPDIAVACSMQDAVVVDLATKVDPGVEVFFLETRFHFPETLETAARIKEKYSLNLNALAPVENPAVYNKEGYEACCGSRKVLPLERYLAGKKAWVSGIRRADSSDRAETRALEWDDKRNLVKVNPIAFWSDQELESYIAENEIIVNPLKAQGFDSIGCWPCTVKGQGREGRWVGTAKTECGLHNGPSLSHPPKPVPA